MLHNFRAKISQVCSFPDLFCVRSQMIEKLNMQLDSTLMFFPSYTCFCCLMFTQGFHSQNSRSHGHGFSRERKCQITNLWKNLKFINLDYVLSRTTYIIKVGKVIKIIVSFNQMGIQAKRQILIGNFQLSNR